MSDEVWEYKRGSIEFVSLSDLCFCNSHDRTAVPPPDAIAAGIRLTADTAKKYLAGPISRGLAAGESRSTFKCEGKHLFTLPNEIFLAKILMVNPQKTAKDGTGMGEFCQAPPYSIQSACHIGQQRCEFAGNFGKSSKENPLFSQEIMTLGERAAGFNPAALCE